jgi:hypothetical protein
MVCCVSKVPYLGVAESGSVARVLSRAESGLASAIAY